MENTRLSNGKVAIITIGCLIAKIIIWMITGFFSLIVFGFIMEPSEPTTGTGITSLQIRNDALEIATGQSVDRYFQVTATGEFTEDNLKFISADSTIATVNFKELSMTNYVYFTVTGIREGTTEIYFETADGSVRSEKIAVSVRSNRANATDGSNHSDSTTISTDSASTNTKTNVSTSTKPANTSTSSQKPASTSTTPASSDTGTTSDTLASTQTNATTSNPTDNNQSNNGTTVYRTPTGTRYHLDPECGGKNSTSTTLEKALNAGLTPCKKCAQ